MLSSTWVGVGGTGLLLSFVLVFCSSFASWASVATAISGTSSDVCSLTPDTSSGFYKVLLRISSYSSSCGEGVLSSMWLTSSTVTSTFSSLAIISCTSFSGYCIYSSIEPSTRTSSLLGSISNYLPFWFSKACSSSLRISSTSVDIDSGITGSAVSVLVSCTTGCCCTPSCIGVSGLTSTFSCFLVVSSIAAAGFSITPSSGSTSPASSFSFLATFSYLTDLLRCSANNELATILDARSWSANSSKSLYFIWACWLYLDIIDFLLGWGLPSLSALSVYSCIILSYCSSDKSLNKYPLIS